MNNLQGGVATSQTIDFAKQQVIDVNKTRWLFNPFEVIDLQNGFPCGHDFLPNGRFVEIGTVYRLVTNAIAKRAVGGSPDNITNSTHDPGLYHPEPRPAAYIASDLTNRYAEKGVVAIAAIQTSDEAGLLAKIVLGEQIPSADDLNNPRHPVPVIPAWLEQIARNAAVAVRELNAAGETAIAAKVAQCAEEVRASLTLALNYCRKATNAAKERIVDPKSANRYFDAHEQRCLLAMGEEIPNELPMVTASQNAEKDIDTKVANAIEKVFSSIADKINPPATAEVKTVAPTAPVVTTNWAKEQTEVYTEEDARIHAGLACSEKTAKGSACKNKPLENGRCASHQDK